MVIVGRWQWVRVIGLTSRVARRWSDIVKGGR